MGSLNEQLKRRYGFNLKERTYVLGGGIAGIVAPIIGTRYLIFPESDNLGQELFAWGASTVVSIVPMVLTVPLGLGIGSLSAFSSRQKRMKRNDSSNSYKSIKDLGEKVKWQNFIQQV